MVIEVYDKEHTSMELDTRLARGGEAEIYPLKAKPKVVCKLYHQIVLDKRSRQLQKKIELMHRIETLRGNNSLCWPLLPIYDSKRKWIGYAMYRASGVTMTKLAHAIAYEEHFPGVDRKRLLSYLLNFLKIVGLLHQQNIMIGDYNLNNILLDSKSDKVTFVDCDSYQITLNNQFFPCEVGSADLTPKEHQNKPFKDITRTIESELFSIAIILFKALMLGRHPYDVVGGDDPVRNLCNGYFPYASKRTKDIPKGCWYVIWTHLPPYIKELFVRVFTKGAASPNMRPTIEEWTKALNLYLKEMNQGVYTYAIRPALPKI